MFIYKAKLYFAKTSGWLVTACTFLALWPWPWSNVFGLPRVEVSNNEAWGIVLILSFVLSRILGAIIEDGLSPRFRP